MTPTSPDILLTLAKAAFWLCAAIVLYTYIGYAALLYLLVKLKRLFGKPHKPASDPSPADLPPVTLMICAYNEEDNIDPKMQDIRTLRYPNDKLKVLWVTDGSTDATNRRLSAYPDVAVEYQPQRLGKAAAVNHGLAKADTEIVLMTDANTRLSPDTVIEIARLMKDPMVGCVSGEKKVQPAAQQTTAAKGEGAYWKYESTLKRWDSELHSAMGAAGELCAVRRSLCQPLPEDTLLDDFILSMKIVEKGYRIAYTSRAYAIENGSANMREESKRKRRIAAGGLQSVWRLRALMNPLRHPVVAFQFVSHRVLRWTITPFALLALIPLNVVMVFASAGTLYDILWIAQILFYAAATAGYVMALKGKKNKILYIPYYFLFMNLNVFLGIRYLATHKGGTWEKAKRI